MKHTLRAGGRRSLRPPRLPDFEMRRLNEQKRERSFKITLFFSSLFFASCAAIILSGCDGGRQIHFTKEQLMQLTDNCMQAKGNPDLMSDSGGVWKFECNLPYIHKEIAK